MFFKNTDSQKEKFLNVKLRDFLVGKLDQRSTYLAMNLNDACLNDLLEQVEDLVEDGSELESITVDEALLKYKGKIPVTKEAFNNHFEELLLPSRIQTCDDVRNFINGNYRKTGDEFIKFLYGISNDEQLAKQFRCNLDEIKNYGYSPIEIYTGAVNAFFPYSKFSWNLNTQCAIEFYKSIMFLIKDLAEYEITRLAAACAYSMKNYQIDEFPSYLVDLSSRMNVDIDKVLSAAMEDND